MIASPCAGDSGPVEEFQTNGSALGWDEAKPGGTFIKIGVGVLRKDSAKYDFVKLYRMVDPGKWSVRTHPDSVEFTQELSDPSTGYAYVYQKTVRLLSGKPEMVLEHQLKNTGRRAIRSSVYNHNFLVLDEQPVGPDFAVTLPFEVRTDGPRANGFLEAVGNRIKYLKKLAPHDVASMAIGGSVRMRQITRSGSRTERQAQESGSRATIRSRESICGPSRQCCRSSRPSAWISRPVASSTGRCLTSIT